MSFLGEAFDTVAGYISGQQTNKQNKQALQHSIQWRVQDARKAGIHPLYALGAPSMSPYATAFESHMGQAIDRSIEAGKDRAERLATATAAATTSATQAAADKLTLENMNLQNHMLRSQIARLNSTQVGPPAPTMGAMSSDPTGRVQPLPAQPIINSPNNDAREAGVVTDYGYSRSDQGGLTVVPSMDVKNRIEDNMVQELAWAWRNQVLPSLGGMRPPDPREFPLPRGTDRWRWSAVNQQFLPYNSNSGMFLINGRWVEAISH